MVALARGMLYDPRWGWHAAAELGGHVDAPPQYWRSQPFDAEGAVRQDDVRSTVKVLPYGRIYSGHKKGHQLRSV